MFTGLSPTKKGAGIESCPQRCYRPLLAPLFSRVHDFLLKSLALSLRALLGPKWFPPDGDYRSVVSTFKSQKCKSILYTTLLL